MIIIGFHGSGENGALKKNPKSLGTFLYDYWNDQKNDLLIVEGLFDFYGLPYQKKYWFYPQKKGLCYYRFFPWLFLKDLDQVYEKFLEFFSPLKGKKITLSGYSQGGSVLLDFLLYRDCFLLEQVQEVHLIHTYALNHLGILNFFYQKKILHPFVREKLKTISFYITYSLTDRIIDCGYSLKIIEFLKNCGACKIYVHEKTDRDDVLQDRPSHFVLKSFEKKNFYQC